MQYIQGGQRVRFTTEAAERYGMDPVQVFTVKSTFPDRRYKRIWVRLAELPEPLNVVKPSDLRAAKGETMYRACGDK